ncbi:MAG: TGS domain-containing protein, partial [Candidatus Diapherotrites archaeon]
HNIRTIEFMPKSKKRKICTQALQFYAPIAEMIGMVKAAQEMRDTCLEVLWPKQSKEHKEKLSVLYMSKEAEIDEAIKILNRKLIRKPFQTISIKKEGKSLYHYFRKINEGKALEDLYDFFYVVIIADSKDACYLALKTVHENFFPIPRKFKDFISLPIGNYKALHTTVIGPHGKPIKIYIRTKETQEFLENGLKRLMRNKNTILSTRLVWLANLPKKEFEEALGSEIIWQEIKVFDENGRSQDMPKGSTVLDFAFKTNPEMADKLIAAKIHGKYVPLSTELNHADRVVLFFAEDKQIDATWVNFAKLYETKKQIIKALGDKTK